MFSKGNKQVFLLIDGNALVHRGFHAIPHLSTKKGEPVNGVYGFALLFLKAWKELRPDYVAAAFDLPGPTFRDEIYEAYKATRVKAPDELYQQIPRAKELVEAFNLPVYEQAGYEADDLIGALAEIGKKQKDLAIVILTGDLDTLQLIDEQVKVYAPKQGLTETKLYDEQAVKDRYGLIPAQLVDFKALRGDPSDNIPGVKGVGEKTAIELLQKFGSLEEIYKYLLTPSLSPPSPGEGERKEGVIKPRVAKLLLEHREEAKLSKKLAQIVTDLPLKLDLGQAKLNAYDEQKVFKLFQELEFRSLLDKLPKTNHAVPPPSIPPHWRGRKGEGGELNYQLVDTPEKYRAFLRQLEKQAEFAVDTETTSQNPMGARLLGIGFCWEEGGAHYLPFTPTSPLELTQILADPKTLKIGQNLKYDYLILRRAGVKLGGEFFDTMIAAYLLNPGARNFDLDTLTFTEFGVRKTPIKSLIGEGRKEISMAEVPVEKVAAYCCEDADYTLRLKAKLAAELKKMGLEKIFYEIEMPLVRVLAAMEEQGVKIAPQVLKKLSAEAQAEIKKLEQKIYRLTGEEFNLGSPQQLKKVLFEKLDIPTEEIKKGKTGLSTAASELEKLRGLHPVIDLISEWRELAKLKNTYLEALPKLVNPETKRLHTSFNQTITATGRLSSSEPNLQNIPIRTEFGRKIRRAFVAEKGFRLVSADYSQIELRLAAHLSGDAKMVKIFKAGGDVHEATAREIFGLKPDESVTSDQRRDAKTINFGVLYGLSAYGLKSAIPGVSQAQAEDFIGRYFETYKGVAAHLKQVVEETRKTGYVRNELGRLRFLPEINSSQYQVRSAAERAAINMPLQSLAADIIKLAMNKLAEEGLVSRPDCRLLLQVHDELVFEIAENKVTEYAKQIVKIMSSVYKLKVPLVVEAKAGENWGEMTRQAVSS